jgi:nitrogen fixation protein NifU and related proteins
MSELRELYQEVILDHGKSPRNKKKMEDANHKADGYNPLCGDKISIFVKTEDGRVVDLAFQGAGCAISTASASMMTEAVKGKTVEEARDLFRRFQNMVTGNEPPGERLGKLQAFMGVSEFPMRVKCATLAWHTLNAAFEDESTAVSTE